MQPCDYYSPSLGSRQMSELFNEIQEISRRESSSLEDVLTYFYGMKKTCHRFEFKYLIPEDVASQFPRVLELKSREAHRFVPVINQCEYIQPCHLGFLRLIEVFGQKIVERILVDKQNNLVLFIEENGPYASINQVVTENGRSYFCGIYLYDAVDDVEATKKVYLDTFLNMVEFAQKGEFP